MKHTRHPQSLIRFAAKGTLPVAFALALGSCQTIPDDSPTPAPGRPAPTETSVTNASAALDADADLTTAVAPVRVAAVEHTLQPRLMGPEIHYFFAGEAVVGNPLDDNFSRYFKFTPSCSFFAYDTAYLDQQQSNAHRTVVLKERIQGVISTSRLNGIFDPEGREAFRKELMSASEGVLFPVHVGATHNPYGLDPASGLRVGDSQQEAGTFRGFFHEHTLQVDATRKTLQLSDGPVTPFQGDEFDMRLWTQAGETLYVDVTHLDPGFVGAISVGVMGRIRRVYTGDIIAQ